MQRKRKTRTKKRSTEKFPTLETTETAPDELAYLDTLPEHLKLVEVTSNIWGTKFKIHGLTKTSLPANLGQVTYKTSLLHLQPRQMTLVITELRDDFPVGPDPNFNPNIFSEDEDEYNLKVGMSDGMIIEQNLLSRSFFFLQSPKAHRRTIEIPHVSSGSSSAHPPIAPMSPRPNRFPSARHTRRPSPLANTYSSSSSSSTSNGASALYSNPPKSLGPLAKAESYEDDVIETPVAPTKQGINYSNLISSYGRSSSSSSSNNQSRVAISPLYCEQSVPTLQSPKNAVAPSDIIFERPPAGQTTLMSYSSSTDYSNNVVQVKNALISDHARQNSHVNPVPLNLNLNLERIIDGRSKGAIKKKDIQYIDDEPTPSTSSQIMILSSQSEIKDSTSSGMNRTQTVVSICPSVPDIITRSCSVGYLDNMELIPGEVTLSQLRKETPKRLVLVDRKIQPNRKYRKITSQHRQSIHQAKFKSFKKSISLDSCDVLQDIPNLNKDLNNLFKQMPKLAESSENTEDTEHSSTELTVTSIKKNKLTSTPKRSPKEKICNFFSSRSGTPILGRKFKNSNQCNCPTNLCSKCSKNDENGKPTNTESPTLTGKPPLIPKWSKKQQNELGECSKAPREHKRNKNLEIITSFTDSPLFSRKYRASKNEFASGNTNSRPLLQSEHNTPILSRRSDNRSSSSDSGQVEVTPIESKTSVSLHTQVRLFCFVAELK